MERGYLMKCEIHLKVLTEKNDTTNIVSGVMSIVVLLSLAMVEILSVADVYF